MRDQRIDLVGCCNELTKCVADPAKEKIRHAMSLAGEDRADADFFQALLVSGTVRTVDATKFLCLYERGKITRAQFANAIRVNREAAAEALSGDELARITEEVPASPALRVTRIKAVEFTLPDAVKHVAAAVAHAARNAD